jgi:hypothetical protein
MSVRGTLVVGSIAVVLVLLLLAAALGWVLTTTTCDHSHREGIFSACDDGEGEGDEASLALERDLRPSRVESGGSSS